MRAILGLGNPGDEYTNTRHNVGFRALDTLAADNGGEFSRVRFFSQVAEVMIENQKAILCKPQTFMNNSGRAARAVLDFYKLELSEILVVCDDFNLDLGSLRARRGGSSGGHNGLESIAQCLASQEFPRLRMGIGNSRGNTVNFVLGRFGKDQQDQVSEMTWQAARAAGLWASGGIEECMNKFNGLTGNCAGSNDLINNGNTTEEQR